MDEALKIADTIVIMRNGQIEQIGTPTELIESPINQFVQDFIGIERINRKRSVGKRELQDLIPSFKRSEQSSYLTVEANILVEEAINLLENEGIESLLVKKGSKELGFVNQSTLLRAMLTKEEVS